MANEISDRQKQLLGAIIKEFIDTAEAVGSINLLDKYDFKFSSATIRNEMAELVFRGYLYKKHSSSGRIPTTKGWRFFVDNLEKDISLIDAEQQKKVFDNLVKVRDEKSDLIRQGLNFLSMLSENCTVALVDNDLYYSGLSKITQIPEFQDDKEMGRLLNLLEDYYKLAEVFHKKEGSTTEEEVNILIGEEETGNEDYKDFSVIFCKIHFKRHKGFIAVIGPNRMDYQKVIAAVKYISDTIRHIVGD